MTDTYYVVKKIAAKRNRVRLAKAVILGAFGLYVLNLLMWLALNGFIMYVDWIDTL